MASRFRATGRRVKDRVLRARWRAMWLWHHARLLKRSKRWFVRELLATQASPSAFYLPRGSDHGAYLRHRSHDIEIVDEVFGEGLYELPAAVRRIVDRHSRPLRALDLGAHVGVFGIWMLTHWPGTRLLSLEPDPGSFALVERTARRSGADWLTWQAAAGASTGWARFTALGQPNSRLAGPGEDGDTIEVMRVDVLPLLGQADLVKMDIEGGEWAILRDRRWRECAPDVLVLEFHPEQCPAEDYERAATEAVMKAGMECAPIEGSPAGAGMLWAWKPIP